MSTYGTAVVVDSPVEAQLSVLALELAADPAADVYRSSSPDGWARMVVWWDGIEQRPLVDRVLGRLERGRSAIAEDYDEFGAAWTVLAAEGGSVRTVHRRYVLNADPTDQRDVQAAIEALEASDPRAEDVAGETAVEAAAALFRVEPAEMRAAEEKAATAELVTGGVGDPFPWWSALRLPWPGPGAGQPLAPRQAAKVTRINRATWPRLAEQDVRPRLAEPDDWTVAPFGLVYGSATWLMQSVVWDGSSEYLNLHAIVFPLYVPRDFIALSWGRQLTNRQGGRGFAIAGGVRADELGNELAEAILGHANEHFEQIGELEGFAGKVIRQQASVLENTGYRGSYAEEVAYTLILLGYHRQAAAQLAGRTPPDSDAPDWQVESAKRMALMASLLEQDPQDAVSQLDEWAQQTAQAIGIERALP